MAFQIVGGCGLRTSWRGSGYCSIALRRSRGRGVNPPRRMTMMRGMRKDEDMTSVVDGTMQEKEIGRGGRRDKGRLSESVDLEYPERMKVVVMSFLSFVICNMDRINVSVAILPMRDTFGWSQATVGIIQSAFFWGYILTQVHT